jgi:hypothetical protein
MLQVYDQMMIDMFLRPFLKPFPLLTSPLSSLLLSLFSSVLSITTTSCCSTLLLLHYCTLLLLLHYCRSSSMMTRTIDSANRSHENNEQPRHGGQELPKQLTQEQFDDEVEIDLAVLLSQGDGGAEGEVVGGAEGGAEGEQRE